MVPSQVVSSWSRGKQCCQFALLHPHWPSPPGPPQPPSGWSVSREGRGLGRKDPDPGSPAGVGGRCGRVTWAGGRWSAGAGRRGAAGGHFGGHRGLPPAPARASVRESILWPQPEHSPPPPAFPTDISVRIPLYPSPTSARTRSLLRHFCRKHLSPRRPDARASSGSLFPSLSQNPNVGFSSASPGLRKSFSSLVPFSP